MRTAKKIRYRLERLGHKFDTKFLPLCRAKPDRPKPGLPSSLVLRRDKTASQEDDQRRTTVSGRPIFAEAASKGVIY
jgi:hypothetical protein